MRIPATLVFLAVLPTAAADLTPETSYALVARPIWTKEEPPKPEEVAAARRVIEAQAKQQPKEAKWAFALGRVADIEGDRSQGDAHKAKRKEAFEQFERAVELAPSVADYQFWMGSAAFDHIDDVNMISKMSLASTGRKAFEKAVELDPNHVAARVGLATFYLQAPSIAGGSDEKAKAQADALLALPDKRGEFQGRMVLARIAADAKNWDEMARQLHAAQTAGGEGADPVAALRSEAYLLVTQKKDFKSATPVVEKYVKTAQADDVTAWFLDGELRRGLGQCDKALPRYDQVLAKHAEARGSRWGAAVCHDTLGEKDAARREYQEFVKRFPSDDRAKEAKAAIKRLGS